MVYVAEEKTSFWKRRKSLIKPSGVFRNFASEGMKYIIIGIHPEVNTNSVTNYTSVTKNKPTTYGKSIVFVAILFYLLTIYWVYKHSCMKNNSQKIKKYSTPYLLP